MLVIATPCPLILATPIALMGGMNAAASKRIIVKRLSAIETLSRITTVIFDKTGTITLGKPVISDIDLHNKSYDRAMVLTIADAIERNSLHPLAKALLNAAQEEKIKRVLATDVHEEIGKGITGVVEGINYTLQKATQAAGMAIDLVISGAAVKNKPASSSHPIARFHFTDQIKENSTSIVKQLASDGLALHIFTGDKQQAANEIARRLGTGVEVKADCSPEDKKNGIAALHKAGKVVAMVGDGINDAPALAYADVGMVFSNEEHTAASEAADIVFLGGNFKAVEDILGISRRTIRIAKESIFAGIGLSIIGMLFAAFGHIPPIIGAFMQETIDILVIFNALRASRQGKTS